jgi:hypothetical protein
MTDHTPRPARREHETLVASGWLMLPVALAMLVAGLAATIYGASNGAPPLAILGIVLLVLFFISLAGFFTLQPNEARVLVLFGDYKGTVRKEGFHFGNPFYSNGANVHATITEGGKTTVTPKKNPRMKISLRSRNLNGERLKVNDKKGNPIEIAAVVVWRVQDTAQAMFDVDDYEEYVHIISAASTPTTTARSTRSRCAAAWTMCRRRCRPNCRPASRPPVWWSRKRASRTLPMRRRWRRRCCDANRPRPCSPRAR